MLFGAISTLPMWLIVLAKFVLRQSNLRQIWSILKLQQDFVQDFEFELCSHPQMPVS